jgi:translation elongation factor EF-G
MKSMKCRIILILCLLAVLLAGMSPVRAEPPRFSIAAPGIAHAVFKVRPADAEPFSGHAFKIDLDAAELRLILGRFK